jgi:hypothetical protein
MKWNLPNQGFVGGLPDRPHPPGTQQDRDDKNLNDIPQDVNVFFGETLARINKQNDSTKALALSVLKWVSAATRPMRVDELCIALSVEKGYDVKKNIYSRKNLDSVCVGLVVIDENTGLCRLAHYTVLEYLRKQYPDFLLEAHSFIARICLCCLGPLSPRPRNRYGEYSPRQRPYAEICRENLYYYAVMNWATHTKSARESQDIIDFVLMRFRNYTYYMNIAMAVALEKSMLGIIVPANVIASYAIHVAAFWGLAGLTKQLLTVTEDPDVEDGYGRTPLSWAAQNGHQDVVQVLTETEGVDVDRLGGVWRETPLSYAAMQGHENVVRQLLGTNRIELGGRDYRKPHHISLGWDIEWNNSTLQRRTSDIFKAALRMHLPVPRVYYYYS